MCKGSTVLVRHATPLRNVRSILRSGLLPAMAKGKLKVVWMHTPARTDWAVDHVAARHQVESVAVLTLSLPRSFVRRNRRGVWISAEPVSPSQIVSVRLPQFASA
jgi:hypothetical protein